MKPIFKDNMCMGSIKQELFFEITFFGIFIKRHLLNFTLQLYSITNFNYLTFIFASFFTSFKTISHSISKSSISHVSYSIHSMRVSHGL